MSRFLRTILIICGTLCVILGLVGMFLPILPTTPFLLLAAICYGRSSERFYNWLINNRWSGSIIRNYRDGRGLPLKQKVLTIVLLWLSIGYAAGFVVDQWWLRAILIAIALGVSTHLIRTKTYRPEQQAKPSEPPSPEVSVELPPTV